MSAKQKIADTRNDLKALYAAIPGTAQAFNSLGKSVKEGGVLDFKTKEFIALGIAVADRCEACILLHVEALIKAGASRDEICDVLGMTIQMGGGPSMMYASKALAIYDDLAA